MLKKIVALLLLVVTLAFAGAYIFMKLEGKTFLESIYYVTVTMATVGYGDIVPVTSEGRILAMLLIIIGTGTFATLLPLTFSYFMEKGIRAALGIESIPKLKDHVVICRYNDFAGQAVEEMKAYNIPFIVIENDESVIKELQDLKILYINGDPSEERTLEKASIRSAESIILASKMDSENAFVGMIAKDLNPKIKMIGIVNSSENAPIYQKIEVEKIIDPHEIALKTLIKNALSPFEVDMLDKISLFENINLGQFQIAPKSVVARKSIAETEFRSRTGASIVAIWRKNEMHPNPSPKDLLEENDILLVLGTASQLNRAKTLIDTMLEKEV